MEVKDAIRSRRSCRAFLPDAWIPKEKLVSILEAAQWSPSWANSQPWDIFVATGDAVRRLREGFIQKKNAGVAQAPEIPFPGKWNADARRRLDTFISAMRAECSEVFDRYGDADKIFFGATAIIYLCIDKNYSDWAMYDLGAYSQSLLLAAAAEGIGGIQAIEAVVYPDLVREDLNIPDDYKLVIGIALGYVDQDNTVNRFKSGRDGLSSVVRWSAEG